MTPNIELLKKIQPLFEKWNMWDRGWDNIEDQEVIYIGTDAGFITKEGVFVFLFTEDRQTRILHYPYLHQMWEKVDWSNFTIRYVHPNTTKVTLAARYYIKNDWSVIADPETALLKALVWQIEQEEK